MTTYIAICMLFIVSALLYYGLILFKLRKISKEAEPQVMDIKMVKEAWVKGAQASLGQGPLAQDPLANAGTTLLNQKDVKLCNKIIRWDRFMILAHLITFILYNVWYFITHLSQVPSGVHSF